MCFAPQRRALFQHPNLQKWRENVVFCTFWLPNVLRATTACTFSTSQLPKVVRSSSVLSILTWKCASRQNGVHFSDISTSKSGPTMVCFAHFDLEMCFAPQRRALFRHLNFQKWSGPEVFCMFWLGNVLRATTACNFSSLIWPAGSAPAALASLLFDPPAPQIIGKTQCFATFLPFRASPSSFFLLFLFGSREGSGEGSGEGLGGSGAEPGQGHQQGSGEGSRKPWCKAKSGSQRIGNLWRRARSGSTDSIGWIGFPALGFAAPLSKICKNKTLRLLGIPPKFIFFYWVV